MAILVFANGDILDKEWIRPYLRDAQATIAADGGVRHLLALGLLPDIVVGDIDSLPQQARPRLQAAGTRLITYPPAKDETDLELALVHAAATFAGEILVFGALGGRLDQMLANILLLSHPHLVGRVVQLVEHNQRAWLISPIKKQTEIRGTVGDRVSLIPLGGDVEVANTTGLQWALQDEVLVFGLARGISNVMTAERATVTIKSGYLLCIHLWQT